MDQKQKLLESQKIIAKDLRKTSTEAYWLGVIVGLMCGVLLGLSIRYHLEKRWTTKLQLLDLMLVLLRPVESAPKSRL